MRAFLRASSGILALALCAPVLAQSDGQALVADCTGYDEGLEGSYGLGIYVGDKNIGTASFEVAPSSAPGATYEVTARMSMVMGPNRRAGVEVFLLDEKFALVSYRSDEELVEGGQTKNKSRVTRREGDAWVHERTDSGRTTTSRSPAAHPDYWEIPVLILLMRRADLARAGTWQLHGIDWDPARGGPVVRDVRLSVPAARKEVQHRGQMVEVLEVKVERVGRDTSVFQVDGEGRVLALSLEGTPVRMVAGTDEEIAADLPAAKGAGGAGADTPEAAVRIYLEVLAKARGVDDLDLVMDWEANYQDMLAENPDISGLGAEGIRGIFKQQFAQIPAQFDRTQLEAAMAAVQREVTGDEARIALSDAPDNPFLLRRTAEGGWLIKRFPR